MGRFVLKHRHFEGMQFLSLSLLCNMGKIYLFCGYVVPEGSHRKLDS